MDEVGAVGSGGGAVAPPSNADLAAFTASLRADELPEVDDAALLERVHRLEQLRAAVAAAQAVETAAFVRSRRAAVAAQVAATVVPGVGRRRRLVEAERGIVADVAVARRVSPSQASRFVGFALRAPAELPRTFALLAAGAVSERRAVAVHQATTWLAPEQRRVVDTELAAGLPGWGDLRVEKEAAAATYRVDPRGAVQWAAAAANERHVTLRPAPEAMTWLSALLPLPQGVAAWAALNRAAGTAAASGDERGRGQVMADTLVERLTGQASADAVPVAVQLVMTDRTLLGARPRSDDADSSNGGGGGGREKATKTGAEPDPRGDEPARLVGFGPLPAPLARDLVLGDTDAARSVRRVFTDPAGKLVAMESTSRCFTPAMAHYVRVRDDTCRTPWCDAPIRHIDHVVPAAAGGPTTIANARGLCARCNLSAQAPHTHATVRPGQDTGDHVVIGSTPTGLDHQIRPPDLPGAGPLHPPPGIRLVWEMLRHVA